MLEIVHRLMATGIIDIDSRSSSGETLFGSALGCGYIDMVEDACLSLGPRFARLLSSVDDALRAAIECKHYNILKLVLE
jgi:hypothetical protein